LRFRILDETLLILAENFGYFPSCRRLNRVTTTAFQILTTSLFTNHLVVYAMYVVKQITKVFKGLKEIIFIALVIKTICNKAVSESYLFE
jgi:hypothetical protein